jgi:hypothetical protein
MYVKGEAALIQILDEAREINVVVEGEIVLIL